MCSTSEASRNAAGKASARLAPSTSKQKLVFGSLLLSFVWLFEIAHARHVALTSKQELAEKHNCLQLECENFESQLRLAERDASSSAKHRDEIAQEHWQHEKGASELLEKSQQQERAAEEFQRRFEEVETALEAAILAKERMEARAAAAEGDLKVGQVWVAGFTQSAPSQVPQCANVFFSTQVYGVPMFSLQPSGYWVWAAGAPGGFTAPAPVVRRCRL